MSFQLTGYFAMFDSRTMQELLVTDAVRLIPCELREAMVLDSAETTSSIHGILLLSEGIRRPSEKDLWAYSDKLIFPSCVEERARIGLFKCAFGLLEQRYEGWEDAVPNLYSNIKRWDYLDNYSRPLLDILLSHPTLAFETLIECAGKAGSFSGPDRWHYTQSYLNRMFPDSFIDELCLNYLDQDLEIRHERILDLIKRVRANKNAEEKFFAEIPV